MDVVNQHYQKLRSKPATDLFSAGAAFPSLVYSRKELSTTFSYNDKIIYTNQITSFMEYHNYTCSYTVLLALILQVISHRTLQCSIHQIK